MQNRHGPVSVTDATSRKKIEAHSPESSDEDTRFRASMKKRYRFGHIIGKSRVMQYIYESIAKAAESRANVVIYGESGTGKELVAREIHQLGSRRGKRFVTVNCGAIPETIIESEFFGYKKGAFTGAYGDKPGYLDHADGGTLFLDEVGEINRAMQVKLLRIIDTGDYIPLGGNVPKKTDVRIVAATNRNLRDMVRNGSIREDFFYRVHIIPIHIPPLRERKEDVPLLVEHFMDMYGYPEKTMDRFPMDRFVDYGWPGNIRELQNVVHRYISMNKLDFGGGHTIKDSLRPAPDPVRKETELSARMEAYEKEIIRKTLEDCRWHRGKAAGILGINRKTLFTKMVKYGLNRT